MPEPLAASEGEAEPRFRGSIRLGPPFPPLPTRLRTRRGQRRGSAGGEELRREVQGPAGARRGAAGPAGQRCDATGWRRSRTGRGEADRIGSGRGRWRRSRAGRARVEVEQGGARPGGGGVGQGAVGRHLERGAEGRRGGLQGIGGGESVRNRDGG
jgi:hypothetical protein